MIHLDPGHFLDWFRRVSKPQIAQFRLSVIAGEMKEHWLEICSDKDRDMATCPDCDSCAYFGAGEFNEATPHFQLMAARFVIEKAGVRNLQDLDLSKIKSGQLRRFVERNQP